MYIKPAQSNRESTARVSSIPNSASVRTNPPNDWAMSPTKTIGVDPATTLSAGAVRDKQNDQPAPRVRVIGHVVECDGLKATILSAIDAQKGDEKEYWAVGQLISLTVESKRVIGMLTEVSTLNQNWTTKSTLAITLVVELIGEVRPCRTGGTEFSGGITTYPHIGSVAHRVRHSDLQTIFKSRSHNNVNIGHLSQDPNISALVSTQDLVSRHFAVLGMTGTGKSTAVSLILRKVAEQDPDLTILVLDPHNEFKNAFGQKSEVITAESLDLPFWIFNFEEFSHIVFRGREPDPTESDVLRQLIPMARAMFKDSGVKSNVRKTTFVSQAGLDSPDPFRMSDLLWLINERIGGLDQSPYRLPLRALLNRITALANDPRYSFMFRQNPIIDNLAEVISKIYRLPKNGKPITSFQLSGLPSETVNAVVSVVCRLAFELSVNSGGAVRSFIVCEEAHRYIPNDKSSVFTPTREAIARIAKEGRKYGCGLGVISQRPRDLDSTILSQCNTFFVLRLASDEDQIVVKSAISSASESMIRFLSSMGDREAIAFGQAIGAPMRITFETVAEENLPSNCILDNTDTSELNRRIETLNDVLATMRRA